jgi:hypothetical protein
MQLGRNACVKQSENGAPFLIPAKASLAHSATASIKQTIKRINTTIIPYPATHLILK